MIGTGVFTSLGFQAAGIDSTVSLLLIWVIGGIVALCGALTYAEIAVRLPRSGGEYHFLSQIYHPAVGFLSGWVSATVGFAAPAALSAMAFANYFGSFWPDINQQSLACIIILVTGWLNIRSLRVGAGFQTAFTVLNVALIVIIITTGFLAVTGNANPQELASSSFSPVLSASFAVSLVYVSFAYSGWNSVTYIIGDIKDAYKNVPKSLFLATFLVMLLYVGLNSAFLYSTPIAELKGQLNVGTIAGTHIFGTNGAYVIATVICLALLASVNSMMMTGPRVTHTVGHDFPDLKVFSLTTKTGTPVVATIFQMIVAVTLILTSTFETVLTYIGFTLSIFTTLTVIGVFILRRRAKTTDTELQNKHYTTWGYPVTPIIFLLVEFWMITYVIIDRPKQSILGLVTILTGLIIYYFLKKKAVNHSHTKQTTEN